MLIRNVGFLILFILSGHLQAEITDSTYTNPLTDVTNIGDPFVLQDGDTYYLYATSNPVVNRGFYVWTSKNLVQWTHHWLAFDNTLEGNNWGKGDFWAPEVIKLDSTYYMVYSASAPDGKKKLALAQSDNPLGPFKNFKAPLLNSTLSCIDGDFFLDDNGKLYLYYVKDCSDNIINGKHVSQIYVQQLMPKSFYLIGDPVLCLTPSQGWEHPEAEWQWNEGPYALKHKHDGKYYLMYSANYFASADYSIGYATAESPIGPWTKSQNNPILKADLSIGVSGPGHNSAAYSPDGKELFVVYHTHTDPNNPSGDRILNIDRMYFEYDALKIKGPTRTPQPLPSGATVSAIEDNSRGNIDFDLLKCYPNPFNSQLRIEVKVPKRQLTTVNILNVQGQRIKTLWASVAGQGKYFLHWAGDDNQGRSVSSGIYICRVRSGGKVISQKISLIK